MLYLTGQILVIVLLASFAGLALGWWSRGLMADMRAEAQQADGLESDPFGARSRLEQCHRDNADLRRELREAQGHLEQRQRTEAIGGDQDLVGRLHAAEGRIQALLDDLQMRDDTLAVLERELEQLRSR